MLFAPRAPISGPVPPWPTPSRTTPRWLASTWLWLALGVGFLLGAPAFGAQSADQFKVQIQYDTSKGTSHPDYNETLANLLYPANKGPVTQGYPVERLPVLIMVRGGNQNSVGVGDLVYDDQTTAAAPFGFLGVRANMPVVENGEDYKVAADGIARLIQHIRWRADELNADPDRILLVGRSFGCVVSYAVAYKEDYGDPAGGPELSQSSRPNYLVARFGPSHLPCFGDDISSWAPTMGLFFFPGKAFEDSTYAERLSESPTWWLRNPELFDRESTPITCVVFKQAYTDNCATNNDVHSGLFGDLTLAALRDFADQTGDRELATKAAAIDLDEFPNPSSAVTVWAVERMAEDGGGMHLSPPVGAIDPVLGGSISLYAFGATPGAAVTLQRSKIAGSVPLAGCPGVVTGLAAPQVVATVVADSLGRAQFTFPVAGPEFGSVDQFQAVDAVHCEISQVAVHRYGG